MTMDLSGCVEGTVTETVNTPAHPGTGERGICPADHKHELTGTCYVVHRCGCQPCRHARAAAEMRRHRLKAYGRYDNGLVDVAPVREHVEHLQEFGYGWKRIAVLAGVGNTTVSQIIYGRKGSSSDPRKGEQLKRIKRETAEKILAVHADVDLLADGATIPARGTQRRVQALIAIGYSQSDIARRIGMNVSNFGLMLKRTRVSMGTHRAVVAVFDELCMTVPAHDGWRQKSVYNRSIGYAQARRWLPPLAWDDIDNDPEPAVVDGDDDVDDIAVELAVAGEQVRLNHAERREAITRAHSKNWSDGFTAERLHLNIRTVQRIRAELGLEAHASDDLVKRGAA